MSDNVSNRDKWNFSQDLAIPTSDYLKKKNKMISDEYLEMLARTQGIFKYDGMPETLSARRVELVTQTEGYSFIADVENPASPYKSGLYALKGFAGGVLDPDLLPTQATINNVALGYNKILTIGKDCVMIPNDSCFIGLNPMFSKYACLYAEAMISLRYALINSRLASISYADNSQTIKDLKKLFENIENGESIHGVGGNPFFEGLKNTIYSQGQSETLKEIIETIQYVKSSWYLDLGLQANYNMKREAINGEEVGMNEDTLLPLIDDMLLQRRKAFDKVNEMFGTNIKVSLSSAWKVIRDAIVESKKDDDKNGKDDKPNNDDTSKEENENDKD